MSFKEQHFLEDNINVNYIFLNISIPERSLPIYSASSHYIVVEFDAKEEVKPDKQLFVELYQGKKRSEKCPFFFLSS